MSKGTFRVEGELYLGIETVAEVYQVRTTWLKSVYDSGLLGRGVESDGGVSIAAVQLDRVATIVRLHVGLGLDLDTISLTLEDER